MNVCIDGVANVVYNKYYLSMQIFQICMDIITIFVVVRSRKYIVKKLFLMDVILVAFCLHAVIFAVTQIHHIIYAYFFATSYCALLISNFTCMFVKIGTQCFAIFLSLMFIVQCMERTAATFLIDRIKKVNHLCWKVASAFMFLIAVFLATLIYYKDPIDPTDFASCWFHTSVSKTRVDTEYYGLMITDTIALIWMLILYLKNKHLGYRLTHSLNAKYQVRENIKISLIIFISGCIYSALIIFHAASNMIRRSIGLEIVVYRVLGMLLYFLSYANLAYVLTLYYLLKKKEKNKIENIHKDVSKTKNQAYHNYVQQYKW